MTDPTRTAPTLGDLIARRYSRRDALRGSATTAAGVIVGGSLLAACGGSDSGSSDPVPTVSATASPASAAPGTRVTITATASDNGSIASTSFVQVGGPAVSLSSTTGTTTSFVVPGAGTTGTIVIRFTAFDNANQSNFFDVSVPTTASALGFTAVDKNRNDRVTIPTGYTVTTLIATGDPIASGVSAYSNTGADADFTNRFGDNGAGFLYFGLVATGTGIDVSNSARGLLAMNHEGITQAYLHPNGPTAAGGVRPTAEVVKETEAHGLSVVEVAANASNIWAPVTASAYNRRVTPSSAVVFNGPVRGNALLQTAFSADGTAGRGTIGNSALTTTAWGTALTSEEKWARYFRRPSADTAGRSAKQLYALNRYGVTASAGLYGWETAAAAGSQYARWNAQASGSAATADYRNEPNQFGWVVEMDPYDKAATVRKRTALGRFAHSGVQQFLSEVGAKPVVYMADAGQNEYLYKFVSNTVYASADAAATDRMAIGDKYLDTGTLYVAKFAADGTGTWVPLTFGTGGLDASNATYAFTDQADVLTHARIAGDILAATPMDRASWIQVNPLTRDVVIAMNGNDARTGANTNPASPRAYVDAPSTQVGNRNGHIIRLRDTGGLADATTFGWDIYAFGAGADLDATNINISGLVATNDFSGPEGLRFARPSSPAGSSVPLMFIQTDDAAFRDVTNNQMLVALGTGIAGDGGTAAAKTVTNTGGTTQATRIGAPLTANTLRRFLVGPNEAAVTGVDTSPDGRTLFVNIQHPGENGTATAPTSNWPANQTATSTARPRSATIVITRTDGGVVGL
ncbi:alkaline phosphatase PhoX [uncultured Sphingomonas sp.]|uniref:PhoX family protein n=1 Tax=uncultured Sphingomonas sp. TaxID=158754 RepID=UPI0025E516FB|nr:alkaline phosphatase PhoX [uncultured Sphingomonas sp.]